MFSALHIRMQMVYHCLHNRSGVNHYRPLRLKKRGDIVYCCHHQRSWPAVGAEQLILVLVQVGPDQQNARTVTYTAGQAGPGRVSKYPTP